MALQLLPDFIAKFHPAFPVGYTSRETVYDYLKAPSNTPFSVAIYLFIDKKGMIRQQEVGGTAFFQNEDKNTRAVIESLLKEPAPARKKK